MNTMKSEKQIETGTTITTTTWPELYNQLSLAVDPRYTEEERQQIRDEEQRRRQRINEATAAKS